MRISDWSSDVCSSDLVGNHFVPLRDPTDGAGEGEEDGEHRRRETDRRQDDARIEIDVREQFLLGEIIVVQRRSEEHTSELQSLMRISYAVFCLKKKNSDREAKKSTSNTHKISNYPLLDMTYQ